MFDLGKTERSILIILLAILLVGLALGIYQKRSVQVDIKPDSFTYSAPDPSAANLKININEANVEQLMSLKGVGKVLADRIVEYRSTSGNFISIEDLKKVKGLGPKLYEKIKDEVSID